MMAGGGREGGCILIVWYRFGIGRDATGEMGLRLFLVEL